MNTEVRTFEPYEPIRIFRVGCQYWFENECARFDRCELAAEVKASERMETIASINSATAIRIVDEIDSMSAQDLIEAEKLPEYMTRRLYTSTD